jgi:hypothetical protein
LLVSKAGPAASRNDIGSTAAAYADGILGRDEQSPWGADALTVARDAQPGPAPEHDPADPLGLAPGAGVVVMADDYGRDPIAGKLVAANRERIVIARETSDLGLLHVHFPRAGFFAAPAGQ